MNIHNWDELLAHINQLLHNYAECVDKVYKFFAGDDYSITVEYYDETGQLRRKTISTIKALKELLPQTATADEIEAKIKNAVTQEINNKIQNFHKQVEQEITQSITSAIDQHNKDKEAHADIRVQIHDNYVNLQSKIEQVNSKLSSLSESAVTFWKKVPRNPTPNDIPPTENALWLNTKTGEIFVCTSINTFGAYWKGQLGNIISPNVYAVVDILGDGSAISLFRFDGNLEDDASNHSISINAAAWRYVDSPLGGSALYIDQPRDGDDAIKIYMGDFRNKTYTFWMQAFYSKSGDLLEFRSIVLENNRVIAPAITFPSCNDSKCQIGLRACYNNYTDIKNFDKGIFHHYAVVFKKEGISLYLDGSYVDYLYISGNCGEYIRSVTDGIFAFSSISAYIDQLRIFNRPLSENEIRKIYELEKPSEG